jgi:uncharacterized protein (TIGR02391 family)
VLVALLVLRAIDAASAVPASKVIALLKVKLRGKPPVNTADALRKASPSAEPHSGTDGGLTWSATPYGVRYLQNVTGLALESPTAATHYAVADLHPDVRAVAEPLLAGNHYAEAVGRAVKELNFAVRKRTARTADEGVRMMMQVFAPDANSHPRLLLGPISHEWEKDRQEGFRFMMAGVQQGIANVDKHGRLAISNRQAALEMLAMVSFLMRQVESALQVP